MANPQRTRGEQRLCSITYSQLAEWTGLALHSVRSYATTGHFERHDIESVLAWVNARRAANGLQMIGQPDSGVVVAKPDEGPFVGYTAIVGPVSQSPLPPTASGGYNPQTGEYDR
jgi:hypothetical protein